MNPLLRAVRRVRLHDIRATEDLGFEWMARMRIVVFELGSRRPLLTSTALLVGDTAAYLLAGIVLALGIESVELRLLNPEPIDFAIELALGVGLLWVGSTWLVERALRSGFSRATSILTAER
jgi:hypothetical protein